MPRIALNKKSYMLKDLPGLLIGKAYTKKLKQGDIAKYLGITHPSLSERFKRCREDGVDIFHYGELLTLFKELEFTDEEILRMMKL